MRKNSGKAQGKAAPNKKKPINVWDYNKAVKEILPVAKQWKKTTLELLEKLYTARAYLLIHGKAELLSSWSCFCVEIGLEQKAVDGWLRKYTPNELSNAGKKERL